MPDTLLEIEIDDRRNRCMWFAPAQRRLRGRFDFARCGEPMARVKAADWPGPIPGVVLGFDLATGEGYIVEPLHAPEHAALKERIERLGLSLPNPRESLGNVDRPTWLYWMRRAWRDSRRLGREAANGFHRAVSRRRPRRAD